MSIHTVPKHNRPLVYSKVCDDGDAYPKHLRFTPNTYVRAIMLDADTSEVEDCRKFLLDVISEGCTLDASTVDELRAIARHTAASDFFHCLQMLGITTDRFIEIAALAQYGETPELNRIMLNYLSANAVADKTNIGELSHYIRPNCLLSFCDGDYHYVAGAITYQAEIMVNNERGPAVDVPIWGAYVGIPASWNVSEEDVADVVYSALRWYVRCTLELDDLRTTEWYEMESVSGALVIAGVAAKFGSFSHCVVLEGSKESPTYRVIGAPSRQA